MKTEAQRQYMRDYYRRNKEKYAAKNKSRYDLKRDSILAQKKVFYQANKDAIKDKMSIYRNENREKHNACSRLWGRNNKEQSNAIKMKRRAARLNACPSWVEGEINEDTKKIYLYCPDDMTVDHIIPLQGKNVSGLHVPWNLQYLSFSDNCRKHNKFDGTYDNEGWTK